MPALEPPRARAAAEWRAPAGGALRVEVMGLTFPTPIGLAAGFDKQGELLGELCAAGFGFAEIGTVTPRPEPGHNPGVRALLANLSRTAVGRRRMLVGISIGKNRETPLPRAVEDYLAGLEAVWELADYVTVNLSAAAARCLPGNEPALCALLARLKDAQAVLAARSGRRVPLAAKVGLDPSAAAVPAIVSHIARHRFDAIVAAIAPGDRGAEPSPAAEAATRANAARSVRMLAAGLDGAMPVISVGGVVSPADARERLEAGAALVQLYRGFATGGAGLVRQITESLAHAARSRESGCVKG